MNITISLLQLHDTYLPTYSECLSSVWRKKSLPTLQSTCYIDPHPCPLKMALPFPLGQ